MLVSPLSSNHHLPTTQIFGTRYTYFFFFDLPDGRQPSVRSTRTLASLYPYRYMGYLSEPAVP